MKMCGIIGFNWENPALIRRMVKVIRHRGPDQSGTFFDKGVSLGHVRLSIVDLSPRGKQPMLSKERDVAVVFNGEIYNYLELKGQLSGKYDFSSNTDTEVLIYGYKEWGIDGLLDRVQGMFAFCIYDLRSRTMFLARDRIGIKPLYYYHDRGKFIFASEIKAILEDEEIPRAVNIQVLNDYFMRRFSPWDETMFQGIRKLMSGEMATYSLASNTFKKRRYYHLPAKPMIRDKELAKRLVRVKFERAVKDRFMGDVPFGAFLSGGFDSTAVVGAMSRHVEEPVKTFSVGFVGDRVSNELPFARAVSEHYGTDHTEITITDDVMRELGRIVWHLDEPLSDPAVIPNYVLAREAKKKVTIILTGDGGDEIFGGYDQYKYLQWKSKMQFLPRPFRHKVISPTLKLIPVFLLKRIYKYSEDTGDEMFTRFRKFMSTDSYPEAYLEMMSIYDDEERRSLFTQETFSKIGDFTNHERIAPFFEKDTPLLNQVCHFDLRHYLPEDLLMKPDKMCMAHAVESRVPLLDHRLVEFAFRIPPNMKISGTKTKLIMKQAFSRYFPPEIKRRGKQTFNVPIDIWFDREFKGSAEGMLQKNIKNLKEYFRKEEVERIISRFSRSRLFYARQLWSLVNFNIWHETFIK